MKNYSAICRYFYASWYLPIAYFEKEGCLYSEGFADDISKYKTVSHKLLRMNQNPAVTTSSDNGMYGILRVTGTENYFLLGPVYSGSITSEMVHAFMSENAISNQRKAEITEFLYTVPRYSYNRFLNVMSFLHLIVNKEEISVAEHFKITDSSYEEEIASRVTKHTYLAREEQQQHGTYFFEQQLLEYVKEGNAEKLRSFLLSAAMQTPLVEGKLADDPLRQAKNLFLGAVTLVGKCGAIPGGLDIEETYQLIDIYIQECERLQSIDSIKNLQFNMLTDFTSRVAQARLPEGISAEIYSCMQFITTHLNEYISVTDVADHIGKSRAYTVAKFKKETGKTIGEYITECRMREAKNLLCYTDMTISEIGEYLSFSSQPYFQNVFHKYYGITPAKYRGRHKKK